MIYEITKQHTVGEVVKLIPVYNVFQSKSVSYSIAEPISLQILFRPAIKAEVVLFQSQAMVLQNI